MSLNINPETERLVREEIRSGHFRSVDEIIVSGVQAWHERHSSTNATAVSSANAGDALVKIDGLWVHQGQPEPGADWDCVISDVRETRATLALHLEVRCRTSLHF